VRKAGFGGFQTPAMTTTNPLLHWRPSSHTFYYPIRTPQSARAHTVTGINARLKSVLLRPWPARSFTLAFPPVSHGAIKPGNRRPRTDARARPETNGYARHLRFAGHCLTGPQRQTRNQQSTSPQAFGTVSAADGCVYLVATLGDTNRARKCCAYFFDLFCVISG
jgi:hypothetical protein